MRDALTRLAPALVEALQAKFGGRQAVEDLLDQSVADNALVSQAIDAEVDKRPGLNRAQRRYARKAISRGMRKEVRVNRPQRVAELRHLVDDALTQLRAQAGTMADGAFLQALQRDPMTPERARNFAEFSFTVLCSPLSEPFVLGDCATWAIYSDGVARLALGNDDDAVQIERLVLPISPSRCVIGQRDSGTSTLTVNKINEGPASLSLELFVSNDLHSEAIRQLQPTIGTALPYLATDALTRLLNE